MGSSKLPSPFSPVFRPQILVAWMISHTRGLGEPFTRQQSIERLGRVVVQSPDDVSNAWHGCGGGVEIAHTGDAHLTRILSSRAYRRRREPVERQGLNRTGKPNQAVCALCTATPTRMGHALGRAGRPVKSLKASDAQAGFQGPVLAYRPEKHQSTLVFHSAACRPHVCSERVFFWLISLAVLPSHRPERAHSAKSLSTTSAVQVPPSMSVVLAAGKPWSMVGSSGFVSAF